MQWLHGGQNEIPANEASLKSIYLIGHSRGGAICAIKAAQDARIRALVTWAAVSSLVLSALVLRALSNGVYKMRLFCR